RNIAWLIATYRLFATDGRHASLAPIRPVVLVVVLVTLMQLAIDVAIVGFALGRAPAAVAFGFIVLLRLLVARGALVIRHSVYACASNQSRPILLWPAAGLAALWTVDLNLYTIAYLTGAWPMEMAALRGVAAIALAVLMALGAAQNRTALRFRPSRAVTF